MIKHSKTTICWDCKKATGKCCWSDGDNPRKISADIYIDDKAFKPITEITHELKLQEGFADAVLNKRKTFEIRRNDRGFQKGDTVKFKVIDTLGTRIKHELEEKIYIITYVMNGYGLQDGYVVFGIKEQTW